MPHYQDDLTPCAVTRKDLFADLQMIRRNERGLSADPVYLSFVAAVDRQEEMMSEMTTRKQKPILVRIMEILDLALYYMPGELGEFPEMTRSDIEEFRAYAANQPPDITPADVAALEAAGETAANAAGLDALLVAIHEITVLRQRVAELEAENAKLQQLVKVAREVFRSQADPEHALHNGSVNWQALADDFKL